MTDRQAPAMRVECRGWWVLAERRVQPAVLLRYDRLRGRLRGRPWWRGLCPRWRHLR